MKNTFICLSCALFIGGVAPLHLAAADADQGTDETRDLLQLFKERAEQRKKPYRRYRFSDTVKIHRTDAYDQKKEIDLGDVDDPKWAPEGYDHVFGDSPLPPVILLIPDDEDEGDHLQNKKNWFTPDALDEDSDDKSHLFKNPADERDTEGEEKHSIEQDTVSHIERQRAADERERVLDELGLNAKELADAAKADGKKDPSIDPSDPEAKEMTPEEVEDLMIQALEKQRDLEQETRRRNQKEAATDVDARNVYRPSVADSDIRRATKPGQHDAAISRAGADRTIQSRSVQDRRIGSRSATEPLQVGQGANTDNTLSRTAAILADISARNKLNQNDASPALSRAFAGHTLDDVLRATHERLDKTKNTSIAVGTNDSGVSSASPGLPIRTLGDLRRAEKNALQPAIAGPAALSNAGRQSRVSPALPGRATALSPRPMAPAGVPNARPSIDFFTPDRNLGIRPASERDPLRF